MTRVYLLDGQEVTFSGLIRAAKGCGYESPDGIFTTSAAAIKLRACGHTVSEEYRFIAPKAEQEQRQ